MEGEWGESRDDFENKISCPQGWTLTSCNCHSNWDKCDGATFDGNTCIAHNSANDNPSKPRV